MNLTTEQKDQIVALAVSAHLARRALRQAEATGAYASARQPRTDLGRFEAELAGLLDTIVQPAAP